MSKLTERVNQLTKTIFEILNLSNIYVLMLDEELKIKFANNCLAFDLGFNNYKELIGKKWMNFIKDEEKKTISNIYYNVSKKISCKNHEEMQNTIIGEKEINVKWFNSYINSNYNWTISFGIKKENEPKKTIESLRKYYKDIISRDRTMIYSLRDSIISKEKQNEECLFIEN